METNKHIKASFQHNSKIPTCLEPLLKHTKIDYFGYNRFYKSRQWLGLSSNYELVENVLKQGYFPLAYNKDTFILKDGVYFSLDMKEQLEPYISSKMLNNFFSIAL